MEIALLAGSRLTVPLFLNLGVSAYLQIANSSLERVSTKVEASKSARKISAWNGQQVSDIKSCQKIVRNGLISLRSGINGCALAVVTDSSAVRKSIERQH